MKLALTDNEYAALLEAAGEEVLGTFCRQLLLSRVGPRISETDRLLLSEVCALRHELELLFEGATEVGKADIDAIHQESDSLREALVENRLHRFLEANRDGE